MDVSIRDSITSLLRSMPLTARLTDATHPVERNVPDACAFSLAAGSPHAGEREPNLDRVTQIPNKRSYQKFFAPKRLHIVFVHPTCYISEKVIN